MTELRERPQGWPSGCNVDEWLQVLHPELVAETSASDGDRRLARWARDVALAAAFELARREPEGRAGRSSLV
jgi:hypothetical protein